MPAASEQSSQQEQTRQLQCMEIIGGNQPIQQSVSAPGLDIWVSSQPVTGEVGGDVHYFSMCGSGRVTRIALADISGHGMTVSPMAVSLRRMMRKYINLLDQTRFAQAINREFMGVTESGLFATVLLATYFAPTRHLILCNAGHPRPIWYNAHSRQWRPLDEDTPDLGPSIRQEPGTYRLKPVANLPLGIIEPTEYVQFAVKLSPGDSMVLYTDALTEARDPAGQLLGEDGLVHFLGEMPPSDPQGVGLALLRRVHEWRNHGAREDDETVIVMQHNGGGPSRMTARQALKSMAKMIGL